MTPLMVLQEILARWPGKNDDSSEESLKERLSGFLADDFDSSDLYNRSHGKYNTFSNTLLIGKIAKILVYDDQNPEYPNLAILKKTDDDRWVLKSFVFWCFSCFGTGMLSPMEPCGTCGATGWGLANYVEGKTAI